MEATSFWGREGKDTATDKMEETFLPQPSEEKREKRDSSGDMQPTEETPRQRDSLVLCSLEIMTCVQKCYWHDKAIVGLIHTVYHQLRCDDELMNDG